MPLSGEQLTRKVLHVILRLTPLLIVLAMWQLIANSNDRLAFVMGSPLGIMRSAYQATMVEGVLVRHLLVTAFEAVAGFAIGMVVGTAGGLALWMSRLVAWIVRPYLIVLGAVPVFALGPMVVYWFGTGVASKVALAFMSTAVIAMGQAYAGAMQSDLNLLRVVRAFGGTRLDEYRYVVVPSALLWVLAGARVAIGAALVGAVVGEFLSAREGLGHMIVVAEGLFDLNRVWVGVLCLSILALLLHACTVPVEKWASRWRTQRDSER